MADQGPPLRRDARYRKYGAGDAAAGRRRASSRRRGRRRLLVLTVFLVVIAAGGAGAWALLGGKGGAGGKAGPSGRPTSPTPIAAASSSSLSPSSPAAPASTSSSPTPTKPTVIEIGWAGDTTPGSRYGLPPDGGRALFTHVRSQLSAPDLMIVNLEGTYSTATTSKGSGPNTFSFQAPPSYAKALKWAGVDLVNMANNHAHDYLDVGMQQTEQALKAVGIPYAGIPAKMPIVDVKGVRVAVLGFSPYPWNNNLNDIPAAARLVRQVAAQADLVIVLMHAGAEGSGEIHTPHGSQYAFGENRGDVRAFSHAVIAAGADLVLGSGPHVIRGIERYKHRLIAYSLGNFAAWGNFGLGGNLSLSGLLTVKIDSTGHIFGGRWLSLYLAHPGVPTIDAANTSAHLVHQLSAADFSQTYTLSSNGTFGTD